MKRFFAFLLIIICLLTISACSDPTNTNPSEQEFLSQTQITTSQTTAEATSANTSSNTVTSVAIATENLGEPTNADYRPNVSLYGSGPKSDPYNGLQLIYVAPDLDYGSYDEPHQLGENIHVEYIDVWNKKINIDISFDQIIEGNTAIKKVTELLQKQSEKASEEHQNALAVYDIYMIQFTKNSRADSSKNEDYDRPYIGAANRFGKDISEENLSAYFFQDENWLEIFVPKGVEFRPAVFIGNPFEAPGLVAAFFFANE
jgi:hypothetical protein